MTLRVPEPTVESIETVRTHLSKLARPTEARERALARANPLNLDLAVPHDVYALGLDAIAEGASIDTAQRVGQRFLVVEGEVAIASAELMGEDAGFEANEGPFVAATAEAIDFAEADPDLAEGNYELRLLRIPGLYLVALWLKDDAGDADVVIPLAPAPPPLEAMRSYEPRELLQQLQHQARARLGFDDAASTT